MSTSQIQHELMNSITTPSNTDLKLDLHANKENWQYQNLTGRVIKPRNKRTRTPLMGTILNKPASPAQGTLLERIRAKQSAAPHIKVTNDQFIASQVPKLRRIICDLAFQGKTSLPIEDVMTILRTNLTKLDDKELKSALQILSKTEPKVCSIVEIGPISQLKIKSQT